MWLTRAGFLFSCGQPVEQSIAAAAVEVPTNCPHTPRPRAEVDVPGNVADNFRKPIHNQNADKVGKEFNESVELKHGLMVALSASNVKAGKCG
jgi:hypothetical protein